MEAMEERLLLRSKRRDGKPVQFGPLRVDREGISIEPKPLTLFIGPQASGKSLLMQMLFFGGTFPYLAARFSEKEDLREVVLSLLNHLRRGEKGEDPRGFYRFVPEGTLGVRYERGEFHLEFSVYSTRSKHIHLVETSGEFFEAFRNFWGWRDHYQKALPGVYIPSERTIYSRLWNIEPGMLSGPFLPLTMRLFSLVLEHARKSYPCRSSPASKWILGKARQMLQGEAYLPPSGRKVWKWKTRDGLIHDLELASSGQMSGWPIVLITSCVFHWKKAGWINPEQPFTLYIEEPEIHLHPMAQIQMVKILAYLANQEGMRVIFTTHSPLFLYVLNTLIEAYSLFGMKEQKGLPEPKVRIPPEKVVAYEVSKGDVTPIIDREGWIDEDRLREAEWEAEKYFNRLRALTEAEEC